MLKGGELGLDTVDHLQGIGNRLCARSTGGQADQWHPFLTISNYATRRRQPKAE